MVRIEIQKSTRESWFTEPIENERIILFDDGEIKEIEVITIVFHLSGEFESMMERIKLIE